MSSQHASIQLSWKDDYLRLQAAHLPAAVDIHYLEAYCRPKAATQPWDRTLIPHTTRLVSAAPTGDSLELAQIIIDERLVQGLHTLL